MEKVRILGKAATTLRREKPRERMECAKGLPSLGLPCRWSSVECVGVAGKFHMVEISVRNRFSGKVVADDARVPSRCR